MALISEETYVNNDTYIHYYSSLGYYIIDNDGNTYVDALIKSTGTKTFTETSVVIQLHALWEDRFRPIGKPIFTLENSLLFDEIWLDGSEVSRVEYSKLYAIYGDVYGTPEHEDNFILPDFTNRVIWGMSEDDDFGYIEQGLPTLELIQRTDSSSSTNEDYDAVYSNNGYTEDTPSNTSGTDEYMSNTYTSGETACMDIWDPYGILGASEYVQPPAVKVRVKTRCY